MRTLKADALYFVFVFGAGFVPGIAPRFGARAAELMEASIMLLIIIFEARKSWSMKARRDTPAAHLAGARGASAAGAQKLIIS